MADPAWPCAACPRVARGLPMPCKGLSHRRLCEHAAAGHEAYTALLCGETAPVDPERAAILARRAKKARVPLGVRPPQGRG